jgi:2-dehydro-3-deoxygluconokinase
VSPPDILAIGEPMVEFNQTGEGGGRSYLQGFGGDSSNFAIAAARQGARAGYVSALGDDAFGAMFRALWAEEGVDASGVRTDPDAPTAVYFVTHGPEGHAFTFFRAGSAAARTRPEHLPLDLVRSAKILHVSGISLAISASACDACFAAVEAANAAGVRVSFDTNMRGKLWPLPRARAIITEMIRLADICLPSLDDVAALYGEAEPDRLLDAIEALGPKVIALKLGSDGALVSHEGRRTRVPPHPVRPVDATGAGDTFGGAFCARLVAGDGPEDAARYAAVAAALSTEGFGAVAPIPRADAVRAAMAGAR